MRFRIILHAVTQASKVHWTRRAFVRAIVVVIFVQTAVYRELNPVDYLSAAIAILALRIESLCELARGVDKCGMFRCGRST